MTVANDPAYKIKSIAFPAISCGVYGYPLAEAAAVTLQACASHAGVLEVIFLVLFEDEAFRVYENCVKERSDLMEPLQS